MSIKSVISLYNNNTTRLTQLTASRQGCSPRDRGLGLESTRDRFFPVLGLGLDLETRGLGLGLHTCGLGLGLGLEGSVLNISQDRPCIWPSICFLFFTN